MAVQFSANGQQYTSTTGIPTSRLFTVTCWVSFTSIRASSTDVAWSIDNSSTSENSFLGPIQGVLSFDWQGSGQTVVTGAAVTTGTWYQTAVSVNGNTAKLYQGTGTSALTMYTTGGNYAIPAATATLRLGDIFLANSYWLTGQLAAFKMWDAELTQQEIERELAVYVPRRTADINRWYPMVTAESTDYSGLGRSLTGGVGAVTAGGPPISWRPGLRALIVPWDPATVVWYAHYDTTTGELLSVGTTVPSPLPSGTDVVQLLGQPDLSRYVWSTTERTFVLREGDVTADRVADLEVDSSLTSVWSTLDATQDQALKDRLATMLGPFRNRYGFQPVDLEAGNPEIGQ